MTPDSAYRVVEMSHLSRAARLGLPTRWRGVLVLGLIAVAALLAGYGIGRAHQTSEPNVDELVRRAYGHDVGHCEINHTLTSEIRETGGGQTAYLCGPVRYSAIIDVTGHVAIGGAASTQP